VGKTVKDMEIAKMEKFLACQDKDIYWAQRLIAFWVAV
jgi:hypothetical protein